LAAGAFDAIKEEIVAATLAPLPRFFWGFWQTPGAKRGFSLMNLWWIAGENAGKVTVIFGLGRHAALSGFIFEDSRFGAVLPDGLPPRDAVTS
jgi:hypothetical protein